MDACTHQLAHLKKPYPNKRGLAKVPTSTLECSVCFANTLETQHNNLNNTLLLAKNVVFV